MKKYILILSFCEIVSCGDNKQVQNYKIKSKYLNQMIQESGKKSELKYSVVIMSFSEGCHQCVEIVNKYVLDKKTDLRILFIVSDQFPKRAKSIFGSTIFDKPNFILDDNDFASKIITVGQPAVLFLDESIISSIESITSENFEIIKNKISQKLEK